MFSGTVIANYSLPVFYGLFHFGNLQPRGEAGAMTKDLNKLAKLSRKREVMANLFRDGKTLREIGLLFGCTPQNIARHLKIHGVFTGDGGQAKKTQARLTEIAAKKDERFLKKYGCTHAEYKAIRSLPDNPIRAFHYHQCHARERGIAWEFNFSERSRGVTQYYADSIPLPAGSIARIEPPLKFCRLVAGRSRRPLRGLRLFLSRCAVREFAARRRADDLGSL
jgi:hypothetical protein